MFSSQFSNKLGAATQYQPTEEDIKRSEITSRVWDFRSNISQNGEAIAKLVTANVLAVDEARALLALGDLKGLISEVIVFSGDEPNDELKAYLA